MTSTTNEPRQSAIGAFFSAIGRGLRTMARNYAAAREIEARRLAFRGLDEHTRSDIGVDRFGIPYRNPGVATAKPANDDANANRDSRRAA